MSISSHIDSPLLEALRSGRDILCVSHVDPDGDAVGSLLGIGWILRRLGKDPVLALQDAVPVEHRVLPGASDIITSGSAEYESAVRWRSFDLVVCVDSSSPDRMGTTYNPELHGDATLVVIDHHVTNTYFGNLNWVDPDCAATCQMLVYLADALQVPLEGELAECLLTGLVTDTLGFRTSNTTADVLGAAMRLMEGGAELGPITQRTVNRRPYSVIKLWGQVLPRVQLEDGVIWTSVSLDDIAQSGSAEQDISLSSFLVTAEEADISAVFTERQHGDGVPMIDCSFRAKPGFDVSQVAFSLGGGGHPPASGCTLPGPMQDAIERVVPALKAARQNSIADDGADDDHA